MTLKSKARKKFARDQGKRGKWREKGREGEKFRRQSSESRKRSNVYSNSRCLSYG